MVQSGDGNGHTQEPEIEKIYEHLVEDAHNLQDRWVEIDEETGDSRIVFGDEVREELGIEEEDDQSQSQ